MLKPYPILLVLTLALTSFSACKKAENKSDSSEKSDDKSAKGKASGRAAEVEGRYVKRFQFLKLPATVEVKNMADYPELAYNDWYGALGTAPKDDATKVLTVGCYDGPEGTKRFLTLRYLDHSDGPLIFNLHAYDAQSDKYVDLEVEASSVEMMVGQTVSILTLESDGSVQVKTVKSKFTCLDCPDGGLQKESESTVRYVFTGGKWEKQA